MQVDVLGPLRVRADDREVDLGGPRSRALVARLALDAGRPVGATTLIDDLWGLDVPADAVNALQSVVSRTRRKLPDGALESTPAGYVLHCEDVDALEFERLSGTGRSSEALALWRGAALADVLTFPFAVAAAARLDELRLSESEAGLEPRARDASDIAVVAELADLTTAYPYRDGFWRLYLTALAARGRTNEALTAYEGLREMLADELGTDPSPELQELHLALLRGEHVGQTTQARGVASLPVGLTSFVGRDAAITSLSAALREHRLVTIQGPGGAGKTRLSIETARASADSFEHVWLVELAPVTGGGDIVATILSALGLLEVSVVDRRSAGPLSDERTRLLDSLAGVRALLILDNCEHLIDDVAAVAEDMLTHAPGLVVLTTSREPLRILGEYVHNVDPLTRPPAGATAEEAMSYSAVQLFVQRASAIDRTFELDEGSLDAVLEICSRLDGQPLALELAAARLRTLTVSQIAARLSDRFRLLTGGSRNSLPRHRTLLAVVEWSWDLLDDKERDLAERIAVFPGGVTAESASAVFDHADDTAELLESLADKSLLVPVRGDVPRFRMLETLREFGVARLIERGIVQKIRTAHVDYFLEFMQTREAGLRGPGQLETFAELDAERGNVTAALRFAVDQRDRARAAKLLTTLGWYWAIRNQDAEVLVWSHAVTELPGEADPSTEIVVLILRIIAAISRNDRESVPGLVEQILVHWDTGEAHGTYVELAMHAIDFFGAFGDRTLPEPSDAWTAATITLMRVVLLDNAGQLGGSVDLLEEALAGFRELGDRWGLAIALTQRATLEAYAGDIDAAMRTLEESVPLLEELSSDEDLEFGKLKMISLRLAAADPEDRPALRTLLEERLRIARESGVARSIFLARLGMAQLERVDGNPEIAVTILTDLVAEGDRLPEDNAIGSGQMRSSVLAALAVGLIDVGRLDEAAQTMLRAGSIAMQTDDMPIVSMVSVAAAYLATARGDFELAARRLGAADQIRGVANLSDPDIRNLTQTLTAELGAARFEALRDEGRALDREAALALAVPSDHPAP